MSAYCSGFCRFFTPGFACREAQEIVGALPGVRGPRPAAPGTKLPPVPAGSGKQFVQASSPRLPENPRAAKAGLGATAPVETIPGVAIAMGVALLNPKGSKFSVKYGRAGP